MKLARNMFNPETFITAENSAALTALTNAIKELNSNISVNVQASSVMVINPPYF